MPELMIDCAACVGCARCVKTCPYGAVQMQNQLAIVDIVRCTLCGACIASCPLGAISIARDAGTDIPQHKAANIWVVAQWDNDKFLPVTFELLGKGRELADTRGCQLVALLLGNNMANHTQTLISAGADQVLLCECSLLEHPLELPYTNAICRMAKKLLPEVLLFGATAFGRSLAPRVAARLRTGLTADCTELAVDPETGFLHQTRPAFGGNLMATILTERHRPQMATVRPGIMRPLEPDQNRIGTVLPQPPPMADDRVRLVQMIREGATASIADANIIVSAGRGIGSVKNLALVRALAEQLGGQFGVSRPLVDMGWAAYRHQIGQTGLSVAPKLLIACGISGAVQHLAGIANAETIVAINSDAAAPIFSVATYKVVGDCLTILQELITQIPHPS